MKEEKVLNVDFDVAKEKARKGEKLAIELMIILAEKFLSENKYREPMKPKNGSPYHCPRCGKALNFKMINGKHIHEYCKACGQAIDWLGDQE